MKNRFQAVRILLTAAVLAGAVKPVQDRVSASTRQRSIEPDLLFFSDPAIIQRMALGYDGLLADLYWMRAIQYYGRRDDADKRPVRYGNLGTLLEVTTTLDPRMTDVYRFGSIFLSEPDPMGAGQPEEALRLLDKGIANLPDNWQLPYEKGFVYYWFLRDYRRAGESWLSAARIKGAPSWMEGLAAMAMSLGGAIDTARALWMRQYQRSSRADIRENARNHLFTLQVNEDEWTLEFLVRKFRDRHGRTPRTLQELVDSGWLKSVPVDPSGFPYLYDRESGRVWMDPESQVRRLSIPPEYRESFEKRLEREFSAR